MYKKSSKICHCDSTKTHGGGRYLVVANRLHSQGLPKARGVPKVSNVTKTARLILVIVMD